MEIMNEDYEQLLTSVHELMGMKIGLNFIRKAQAIVNKSGELYAWYHKISKEQHLQIRKLLIDIIDCKFLQLNPNFDVSTLEKLRAFINNGMIRVTKDITVVNDVVFFYVDILDDFGQKYKTSIFLVNRDKKEDYKEINNRDLSFSQNKWENDFDYMFDVPPYMEAFDSKKTEKLVRQIVSFINNALEPTFHVPILYPIADLNTEKIHYGTDGIDYVKYIRVFLNYNLNQIKEAIFNRNQVVIQMIVLAGWNEFYCYEIYQTVTPLGELHWDFKPVQSNIWNFSEAINQKETKCKSKSNSLIHPQ